MIRTEDFSMEIGARIQVRYTYLDLHDGPGGGSFQIRRGRFSLGGDAYGWFEYEVQLELAGGSAELIDANVRYRLASFATLWGGQGKAPFGRQQLTSSGALNFVDRTLVDSRFSAGRQTGVAVQGRNDGDLFEYGVGIYNGNGINASNPNDEYMTVARAVWTPFGPYEPEEIAFDRPAASRVAMGAAALSTTDGEGPDATDVTRYNLEGAFKRGGFNVTTELYLERATPAGEATLETRGGYAQAGFLFSGLRNEIAVRYGLISPRVASDGDRDIVEAGVAVSHYFVEHHAKIQADLRRIERTGPGAEDLEARLQFQLSF